MRVEICREEIIREEGKRRWASISFVTTYMKIGEFPRAQNLSSMDGEGRHIHNFRVARMEKAVHNKHSKFGKLFVLVLENDLPSG